MTTGKLDLETLHLTVGSHAGPEEGACVMEMVSWIEGEPWSDRPECVSTVLGAFLRGWNDDLDDEPRQRLKPFAYRVGGTAGDGLDGQRAALALDWLVRVLTATFLRAAGFVEHADRLASIMPGTPTGQLGVVTEARDAVQRHRRAVLPAMETSPSAMDSALAAMDSALAAAGREAAWLAATYDERALAQVAAQVAEEAATLVVVRDASALADTVAELQESAFDLVDRMLALRGSGSRNRTRR